MTPATRTRHVELPVTLPAWGAWCFFASGAAGLLYEVVWSKQLAYVLGSSLHAVATVVAAFLCGLALGARVLGVPLARRGHGPRVYALLEWGVGVLGVISLPVLRGIEPLVGTMYRALGGESAAFAAARFGLLFVLLIPPAALMGATLPVLVGHFERRRVGPALARLYALNTFGAVAGTLAGGFALLPALGLAATSWIAAALNAGVGLVAWSAGRSEGTAAVPAEAPVVPARGASSSGTEPSRTATHGVPGVRDRAPVVPDDALTGHARTTFALLFAVSGFAALVFQIAWVRLFTLMFGSSVYSFSAVLGVYLLGLAIGSSVVGLLRRGVPLAGFARLQLVLAATAAFELNLFSRLPDAVFDLAAHSGTHWTSMFVGEVGMVAGLLLLPCALLGAMFPIAARLLQSKDGGHAAGFAYAVNTAGTIAGSLAAGFLMIPAWGVQGTHLAALLLSGGVGIAALLLARARGSVRGMDWGVALVAIAATAAFSSVAPRWDPALMSAGAFRPVQALNLGRVADFAGGSGSTIYRATRDEHVLYYREGVNGSVYVGTDAEGKERWLRVGGKIDASTQDMETQVLLGLIPGALADSGARSLVIGLGSGATAAAVLAAGAGSTDVVELERGVVEASRFFHAPGRDPLDDPRVHLVVGDARTHLEHGRGRYGLIVSEPSNPWIAGVNNLFTVDFYRRVKTRLEPDGVFCQWMQLYELSPETFSSMVASFLDVFPEGQVFSIWRAVDVLLVATPGNRRLATERLATPAARAMLAMGRIPSADALAGYYAGPFSALRPVARGAPLNTDDRPIVEYRAPRDLVTIGRSGAPGHPRVLALVPFAESMPAGPLFAAWTPDHWYESRARRLIEQGEIGRAGSVASGARAAGYGDLASRLVSELAAGSRRAQAQAIVTEAMELNSAGHERESRRTLERALEVDPTDGHTWMLLADRRRLIGDLEGAQAAIERARQVGDPDVLVDADIMTGLVLLVRRKPADAAAAFLAAQRRNPALANGYALESRARIAAGDTAQARAALLRGLGALPGDAQLESALAALGR